MQNIDKWQPTKYIYHKGKFIASRNRKEVGVGSRLMADLIADFYSDNLPKHTKGNLLDLGCGKVPLYIVYKAYISNNICVDWENTSHKNDFLDFEYDLAKDLPFKDGEFDTIILSDVLEHILHPEHLWKEMSRILSINGKIIMNVPFYYWLHEKPHDYYRYTEFALRYFIENSGLKIIMLEPIGGAFEIMADIFSKSILHLPKFGIPLSSFTQWVTSKLIKTRFGKKVSEATKTNFPFGYFVIAKR